MPMLARCEHEILYERPSAPADNLLCFLMLNHVPRLVHQLLHSFALHIKVGAQAIADLHVTPATLTPRVITVHSFRIIGAGFRITRPQNGTNC
jgi:hypothetical protein